VPRVPSPASRVTSGGRMSSTLSASTTPPSTLLRTHAPVLTPRTASVCKPCAARPCRLRLAPAGERTFPTLSLWILLWMPGPLPRWPPRCTCSFLPSGHRPSPCYYGVGDQRNPYRDFRTGNISGLQSFTHVLASAFASPPDRSHRRASVCSWAAGALTSGHTSESLPTQSPDLLTVRIEQLTVWGLAPHNIHSLVGYSSNALLEVRRDRSPKRPRHRPVSERQSGCR